MSKLMFAASIVLAGAFLVALFWYYSFMYQAGVPLGFLVAGILIPSILGDTTYAPVNLAIMLSPGIYLL